ncbi:MAG TPA: cytochrome c [Candidatus Limnocylindrales bacterium]|nr:cytochrome c [Candidatus Limnocylindrales bacterium]
MTKSKLLGLVVVVAVAVAVVGYQVHARRTAAGSAAVRPPVSQQSANLRQVMESRVHQEYTHMSFIIWHDQPLTPDKLDTIADSSGRIMETAKGLDSFEAAYQQQGWSAQDVKFFEEKRLQLSRVAEELQRAARKRDSAEVVSFFMHLDNTCQSCHKRFRPDLSWT